MRAMFVSTNNAAEVGLLAGMRCRSYGEHAGTTALSFYGQCHSITNAQALGACAMHQ